jgi:flagellar M-ring protein FliF
VQQPMGGLKRLSVAVVVNYKRGIGKDGKPANVPLTDAEKAQIGDLVKEAMGFNKERGDSMNVVNTPFMTVEPEAVVEPPLWKQPGTIDLLRSLAVPAALALIGMLVFFGLIRPALKAALAPAPAPARGATLNAVVDDRPELPALPAPQSSQHLAGARALAKDNPAAVAGIVRGWVNGEAAAARG